MTSAQVVETSVNVISNSPSQDYTHPDDRTLLYSDNKSKSLEYVKTFWKHLVQMREERAVSFNRLIPARRHKSATTNRWKPSLWQGLKTFTKDPREPYFVLSAHLQTLQNSSADLTIWGFLPDFRRYIFFGVSGLSMTFARAKSYVLIFSLELTVSPRSHFRLHLIGSFGFDDLTDQWWAELKNE